MKIINLITAAALMCCFSLSARDNHAKFQEVPEQYNLPLSWHEVKVNDWSSIRNETISDIEVRICPDSAGTLRVLANEAMMQDLRITSRGSELVVSLRSNGNTHHNRAIKCARKIIAYTDGDIAAATVVSTGDIDLPALKTGKYLELTLSGTGDITLDNAVLGQIEVLLKGTGDIEISNTTVKGDINVSLNGTGDVELEKIKAKNVNCTLRGTGDIEIKGTADELNLAVTGTGDIDAAKAQANAIYAEVTGTGGITLGKAKTIKAKGENIRHAKKIKH